MKDDRLSQLSDKVRKGISIDFDEALEVIAYQTNLRKLREANSWYKNVCNKIKKTLQI